MLKTLMAKGLIVEEVHDDKRLYKLIVTEEENRFINLNKMKKGDEFLLFSIANMISKEETDRLVNYFEKILICDNNKILLSYI